MTARTFTLAHLTDVERIAVGYLTWLPLRRVLGATGFGIGQLACFHARAGRLDDARRSLDIAFAGDERTREWAAQDDDLAALRE